MIALLQRVIEAKVSIDHKIVVEIGPGLLAFIAVQPDDDQKTVDRMLERILNYRLFKDAEDKMNLSLRETAGGLLLVSQFTLAADTKKGNRPSFSRAASPEQAENWFNALVQTAKTKHENVATGQFAADMQVSLCNDGPVTIWLTA